MTVTWYSGPEHAGWGHGSELLYRDGEYVSYLTSAGFSHFLSKPVGLTLIPKGKPIKDSVWELEVPSLDGPKRFPALVSTKPAVDPKSRRVLGEY